MVTHPSTTLPQSLQVSSALDDTEILKHSPNPESTVQPQCTWNSIATLEKASIHLKHLNKHHPSQPCGDCGTHCGGSKLEHSASLFGKPFPYYTLICSQSKGPAVMKMAAKEIPEANVLVIDRQIKPANGRCTRLTA